MGPDVEDYGQFEKRTCKNSGAASCYLCDYCKDKGAYSAHGETLTCPYCDGKDRSLFVCECGEDFFYLC